MAGVIPVQEIIRQGRVNQPFSITLRNGQRRCAVVEIVTNNRLAPGTPVPQVRFTCTSSCPDLPPPRRPSKACRRGVPGQRVLTLPAPGASGVRFAP